MTQDYKKEIIEKAKGYKYFHTQECNDSDISTEECICGDWKGCERTLDFLLDEFASHARLCALREAEDAVLALKTPMPIRSMQDLVDGLRSEESIAADATARERIERRDGGFFLDVFGHSERHKMLADALNAILSLHPKDTTKR